MTDWDAIVKRHGALVWASTQRIVGNLADTEDCVQETFLAAIRTSQRQNVRSWPALLRRIAIRTAIDRLRQRTMRGQAGEEALDTVQSPGPDPLQHAQTSELAVALRANLAQLPPAQAGAFCLRYFDELSNEDIGEVLGTNANAVGVLLHRARERLRDLMRPLEISFESETSNESKRS